MVQCLCKGIGVLIMEYFSNTDNLFKQYSDMAQAKKRIEPKKVSKNDAIKEIVGYDQRFRSKKISKDKKNQKMIKVPVSIAGMQHIISVREKDGESFIEGLADRANRLIEELRLDHPGLNMSDITVLALINALDQLIQSEENRRQLSKKIKSNDQSQKILQSEYAHLQVVNQALKNEVYRLKEARGITETSDQETSAATGKSPYPLDELLYRFDSSIDSFIEESEEEDET